MDIVTPPTLLTTKEAGERLRLAPRTIRFWVENGWLHPVRLGRRTLRFREDEINRIAMYGRDGFPPREPVRPVDSRGRLMLKN